MQITFFFSKNISIFNDQSFYNTLTNGIFSFEQLGPGVQIYKVNIIVNKGLIISKQTYNILARMCRYIGYSGSSLFEGYPW